MKRRTLDILFSVGGLGLAGLLAILGLVLASNAKFARTYVNKQLSAQKITFKSVDKLTAEEKEFTKKNSGCLVTYAGQPLSTGKQAECYANEFIGLHLKNLPNANGKTYSELGEVQGELRSKVTAAQASSDPALPGLQKQLTDTTAVRETVFKGEMLRGALLTSFGFGDLGEKAAQASQVAYAAAALLALLSIAGFVHAFVTPKTKAFAPVDAAS